MKQPIEYEDRAGDLDVERRDHREDEDGHLCWCDPDVEVLRNDDDEYVGELVIHRGFEE
jgi:hypothetical protein